MRPGHLGKCPGVIPHQAYLGDTWKNGIKSMRYPSHQAPEYPLAEIGQAAKVLAVEQKQRRITTRQRERLAFGEASGTKTSALFLCGRPVLIIYVAHCLSPFLRDLFLFRLSPSRAKVDGLFRARVGGPDACA